MDALAVSEVGNCACDPQRAVLTANAQRATPGGGQQHPVPVVIERDVLA